MSRYIFDIETDGLLDDVSKLHSVVLKDADTGEVFSYGGHSWASDWKECQYKLLNASELIGHNIICYDLPALEKLTAFRLGAHTKITDTLTISHLIWTNLRDYDFVKWRKASGQVKRLIGSHSLKAWGYRLGLHKGEFADSTDWSEWSEEMQRYCERDVDVTEALYKLILSKNYAETSLDLEHAFRTYLFWQEQTGFEFDEQAAGVLYAKLAHRKQEITDELQEVFPPDEEEMKTPKYWLGDLPPDAPYEKWEHDVQFATKTEATKAKAKNIRRGPNKVKLIPFNPGSRKQIAERLTRAHGWEPQEMTPSGKDPKVDETVLERLDYPEAKLLAEYLMLGKRLGQLADGRNAWLKLVVNGRIHGRVNTNGAVTGRCTHSDPNLAQVPGVYSPFGSDCRALFIAAAGRKLVGGDASGLELRCLGHYMAPYDGGAFLKVLTNGDDIHEANARLAGCDRATAKTMVYALCYGAGDRKLGLTVYGALTDEKIADAKEKCGSKKWARILKGFRDRKAKYDTDFTLQDVAHAYLGGDIRARFLKALPALEKLIKQAQKVAKERGWLKGLDGRRLHCRSAHSALNTLLQSAGALIMKKALVLFVEQCEERGWHVARHRDDKAAKVWLVANVHDEVQAEALPDIAEKVGMLLVDSMRQAGEFFNFRCRIDGEFSVGDSWRETH